MPPKTKNLKKSEQGGDVPPTTASESVPAVPTNIAQRPPQASAAPPAAPPAPPTVEQIRGASDRNVEGYLRNVSIKARHASAGEGGRGTKVHRTAAVTWNETRQLKAAPSLVKKKDETESTPTPVASPTSNAPQPSTAHDCDVDDGAGDDEWEVVIQDDQDDVKDADLVKNLTKPAVTLADVSEPPVGATPSGEGAHDFMGARAEQRVRGDALWELRQAAKARRWVEKNALFAKSVAGFVCLTHQLHHLYRSAHHPSLASQLCTIPAVEQALVRARDGLSKVDDRGMRGNPSPAWINAAKDGCGTKAGAGAHAIVVGLNTAFEANVSNTPIPHASNDVNDDAEASLPGREQYRAKSHIVAPVPPSWNAGVALDPAQFCVAFLALARRVGLDARLCVAFALKDVVVLETVTNGANEAFDIRTQSHFKRKPSNGSGNAPAKKPESSFWCEVWCDTKQCFLSVNPCKAVTTRWGAPHVLAYGGDHTVDVAAKYASAWSKLYKGRVEELHYTKGFLWKDEHEPEKPIQMHAFRSATRASESSALLHELNPLQRLLWPMCRWVTEATFDRLTHEGKQLVALKYSEAIPTKIQDLKGHPLFVLETDITRYEGIYPKNASTTVGYVKGRPVFRRDAVHALRSRMGWLRLSRMVPDDVEAYRVVPPPPNRPLVSPSQMFGRWQTVEFRPKPINADGTIPRHYGTSWYMMLNVARPGEGLTHLTGEGMEGVARRIRCEFALAVVGFEKKQGPLLARGKWIPQFKGVVVANATVPALTRAHTEWLDIKRAKEAAARRKKALGWWRRLIELRLAQLRVQRSYVTTSS